jgi:hypothetical protein
MSQIDDFLDGGSASGSSIDSFLDSTPAKAQKQNTSLAGDIGTGLKRGVLQMPGMVTGLADLATTPIALATGVNRPISKAADWAGEKTGFQPEKWAKNAEAEYSPEMQQAQANVEKAQGFFPTIGAVAENPRVAAQLVAESLPSTIAGGVLARGAMGAVMGAEKLAALRAAAGSADIAVANAAKAQLLKSGAIAAGIGEGAVTSGQQMSQTGYEVDPALAASTALAAGIGTGVIGAGSGRLASSAIGKRLGLSDLETSMAAGTLGENTGKAGLASYAKRIGAGTIQEGLLEEAPQSYQEQVWQNLASGKPWDEGAASAAAQGAIAGGLMGGAVNAIPRKSTPAPEVPPAIPDPSTGGTFTPDPNGGVLERGLSAMATAKADVDALAPRAIDTIDRGLELIAPPTATNNIPDSELPIVGQEPVKPVEPQRIVSGNEADNPTGRAYGDALAKQQRGELLTASDVTALKYPPPDVEILKEPSRIKKNQSIEPVKRIDGIALPDTEAAKAEAQEQLAADVAPTVQDSSPVAQAPQQPAPQAEQPAADAPATPNRLSSEEWRNEGMTPDQIVKRESDAQADELAGQIRNESDEADFAPKETVQAAKIWAKDKNIPDEVMLESLREAIKKGPAFRRKAGVLAAINQGMKKSEATPATTVAESKAPAPKAGDGSVATAQGGAASEIKDYPKAQATALAASMTKKGLPSEAYPHPSMEGRFAIRATESSRSTPRASKQLLADEGKVAAIQQLPPKSFRKQQIVTTKAYDEESGKFVTHETDAESALKSVNEDIKALIAFRACIAGG